VSKHHGKYAFGDEISLADVLLVPQVGSAVTRFQLDLNNYPTIKGVYENLKDIPEFVAAQPDKQPDFK
jgi:glutathione S-transferase